jgi:hypothetical protein
MRSLAPIIFDWAFSTFGVSADASAVGATAAITAPLAADLRKDLLDLFVLFSIIKYNYFKFSL